MTNREAIDELCYYMNSDCYIDAPSNEACALAIYALTVLHNHKYGCEFCCQEYSINDRRHGAPHELRIENRDLYVYDVTYGWEGIQINYCPMCGRPLEREMK